MANQIPDLVRITVDLDSVGPLDVTYYFADNPERPFNVREFKPGTQTRITMERLEQVLVGTLDDGERL